MIGLPDRPGVVKELDYGSYILLAPEWINAYGRGALYETKLRTAAARGRVRFAPYLPRAVCAAHLRPWHYLR